VQAEERLTIALQARPRSVFFSLLSVGVWGSGGTGHATALGVAVGIGRFGHQPPDPGPQHEIVDNAEVREADAALTIDQREARRAAPAVGT
jgi:hypothetical protein